jgi:hypothetical protein
MTDSAVLMMVIAVAWIGTQVFDIAASYLPLRRRTP